MANLIKRVIGILLLILSFWWFKASTFPNCQQAFSSRNWPSVMGKIITSEVQTTFRKKKRKQKKMYQLAIEYQYEIENTSFKGSGRYFDFPEPYKSNNTSLVNYATKHPKGSAIKVFYDPDKYDKATIKNGFTILHWVMLFGNLLFFFIASHLATFPHLWRLTYRSR